MRKATAIMLALTSVMLIAAIVPAHGTIIGTTNWIAPIIKNQNDAFFGYVNEGYQAGSNAQFYLNIRNPFASSTSIAMNVSNVTVEFDWGMNYSDPNAIYSRSSPWRISPDSSRVLLVTIPVESNTSIASNFVLHTYTIFVEYVNASGGVDSYDTTSGSGFAVLSSTQAQDITLQNQLGEYSLYPTFLTSQAKEQLLQAQIAKNLGDAAYKNGDFSGASSYYTNASTLIQSAYSDEYDKTLQFENAFLGVANGAVNMLNMMGIGYTLFGIGFFFMGIGVLVYLVRKSGQKQNPPQ